MNLYARCKTVLAWHFMVREFCHDCGRRVDQVWTADGSLWVAVVGINDQGPRCIECFTKRAENRDIFIRWVPIRELPK